MALIYLLCLLLTVHHSTADPPAGSCGGSNYSADSTFSFNLNELLWSLSLNSTNSTFASITIGSTPNQAYGLFLCRGDISLSDCSSCVNTATKSAFQFCRLKQATIWYDTCQLRFSDQTFSSSSENTQRYPDSPNATDPATFSKNERLLMTNLSLQAAYNSSIMFATGKMLNGDGDQLSIYGLVQCTRDLSQDNCSQCLNRLFEAYQCYDGQIAGGILGGSCSFRYNLTKFFDGEPDFSINSPISSSAPTREDNRRRSRNVIVICVIISTVIVLLVIFALGIFFRRRSAQNSHGTANPGEISRTESLYFDLSVLKIATANFSDVNKLGQGGFGAVYKGILPHGEEIAVKRLSAYSRQGIEELKNELLLVAKLQHRNLVRLRGVCLEEGERLLVYEYMPNGSLDKFLFEPTKRKELNWERRFKIIGGIARGLLYLHEESHLKVIHRDLKSSNVLLDTNMKPKISDFGLARLFGGDETHAVTCRVVGTYGYMAPEYARHGRFSTKLDVYSYGILVLEIVTGRKNSAFKYDSDHGQDLLSYAWKHWRSGTALKIIDKSLGKEYSRNEAFRSIQIGLLCAQEIPVHRPSMPLVFLMLNSPSMPLQDPLPPAYLAGFSTVESDVSSKVSSQQSYSCSTDRSSTNRRSASASLVGRQRPHRNRRHSPPSSPLWSSLAPISPPPAVYPSEYSASIILTEELTSEYRRLRNYAVATISRGSPSSVDLAAELQRCWRGSWIWKPSRLSNDSFLVRFPNRERLTSLCDGSTLEFSHFSASFNQWTFPLGSVSLYRPHRIWIQLIGIPLCCRRHSTIQHIVQGFGSLVRLSSATSDLSDLTSVSILLDCYKPTVPSSFDLLVGDFIFKIEVKCLDSESSSLSGHLASVAVPAAHGGNIHTSDVHLELAAGMVSGGREDVGRHIADLRSKHRSLQPVQDAINDAVLNSHHHPLPTFFSFEASNPNQPLLDLDPSIMQMTPTVPVHITSYLSSWTPSCEETALESLMSGVGLDRSGLGLGEFLLLSSDPLPSPDNPLVIPKLNTASSQALLAGLSSAGLHPQVTSSNLRCGSPSVRYSNLPVSLACCSSDLSPASGNGFDSDSFRNSGTITQSELMDGCCANEMGPPIVQSRSVKLVPSVEFSPYAASHDLYLSDQNFGSTSIRNLTFTAETSVPQLGNVSVTVPSSNDDSEILKPLSSLLKRPLRRSSRNLLSEGPRSTSDRIELAGRVRSLEIVPPKRVLTKEIISAGSLQITDDWFFSEQNLDGISSACGFIINNDSAVMARIKELDADRPGSIL